MSYEVFKLKREELPEGHFDKEEAFRQVRHRLIQALNLGGAQALFRTGLGGAVNVPQLPARPACQHYRKLF